MQRHGVISLFFPQTDRQLIAPPESEWYHGRLDRYSAEQRLRSTGKLGSYLGMIDSILMKSNISRNLSFFLFL